MRLVGLGVMLGLVAPLIGGSPAVAAETPATPTLTSVSASSSPVQNGEQIDVAWTGDSGGLDLFYVKAVYRDFDWGFHELMDGVGDTPTTGFMRGTVDSSWASGPAIPVTFEIFDVGGNGRIYYFDDPRTSANEERAHVYADGNYVDTEYDVPDLFTSTAVVTVRETVVDTEPPTLDALSLAQTTVLPGDSVTLNWSGVDDHTGIVGVRVKVRDSDGGTSEVIEEYVEGPPPTGGRVQLAVPANASEGIYEVMQVSVFDNACNERYYVLRGPDAQPETATADCGLGTYDPDATTPGDLSIAPLAAGVVMSRPPMEAPGAPTELTASCSADGCTVDWSSASAWSGAERLQFYDWLYQVELDGEVIQYPWPETEVALYNDELSPGRHSVRVRAVNRFGPGPWSGELVFATYGPGSVLAPATIGRLWGARVAWGPPTDGDIVAHYLVVRRPGARTIDEMPDPASGTVVASTSLADLAVTEGRSYTYAIYAVDLDGQVSEDAGLTHLVGTRTRIRDAGLEPGDELELRGRVTTQSGAGVPSAPVVVQRAPITSPTDFSTTARHAETDGDGRYRLTLTPRAGWVYRVASTGVAGHGASWSETLTAAGR
jgi:hypothetical protein